jgi:predicted transcriptional regulator
VKESFFFTDGKRVAEVLSELQEDPKISNKVSVLLSQYCKKGQLTYFMDGPIKRYQKIKNK